MPLRSNVATGLIVLALAITARAADVPPDAVSIEGTVAKSQSWNYAQLKTDFAKDLKTIAFTAKKESHTAAAIPLLSLINAAEPVLNAKIKNHLLRFVVVVEGKDGYTATFTLADLQPDIGKKEVWIAIDTDGKPLPEREAPATLIVPGDEKPGRWVHQIKIIRILDAADIPQPAKPK